MSMFPENDRAELEVKKIVLKALEEKKKEIDPFTVYLGVEIDSVKRDIEKLERDLEKS